MSLFGAMTTAISGLTAQSAAFTNISDNTANSQTIGYKNVDTAFIDYLTTSNVTQNQSGSVVARPEYENDVQGTIQQSTDSLATAIDGNGFFAVSEQSGQMTGGAPIFSKAQYYTRAGDFKLDQNGYMKNSAGETLDGWAINPTNGTTTNALAPIQIAQNTFKPVATSSVALTANVPATPGSTSNLESSVQVYDSNGTAHELDTTWSQTATNAWKLTLSSPDNAGGATIGTANLTFNANGTLASLTGATGAVVINSPGTTNSASLTLSPNFAGVTQPIKLGLGTIGGTDGITQFAGTDYDLHSITQNGAPPGAFTGISIAATGTVNANYDNGQSVAVAQVPVVTFENADALQRQNGQAFTATAQSGAAVLQNQNQNGAGTLVTGSVEASNVDIATQLSNLIVAQQAYGANAKVITTADQMLQTTLAIRQ